MQTGVALPPVSGKVIPPQVRPTTRAALFVGRAMRSPLASASSVEAAHSSLCLNRSTQFARLP